MVAEHGDLKTSVNFDSTFVPPEHIALTPGDA